MLLILNIDVVFIQHMHIHIMFNTVLHIFISIPDEILKLYKSEILENTSLKILYKFIFLKNTEIPIIFFNINY